MTSATPRWRCCAPAGRNVDDVEHVSGGKTFFWKGRYHDDMNTRDTLETQLNVFEQFEPKLSQRSREADVLFLANIQPGLQLQVREQCEAARFVALDSMNLWIDIAREELEQIIGRVDCLILNDEELRQLTGAATTVAAAREVLQHGPSIVVAKQGEYGAALITADDFFALPAYPLEAGRRPDRRRRHVRGRLRRADRQPARPGPRRRGAAQRDGVWHRARVLQRRAVRDRGAGVG